MWVKLGRVPPSCMDNATDTQHGYYNFHMEVQYAINDLKSTSLTCTSTTSQKITARRQYNSRVRTTTTTSR
eukprot:3113749-Amphidinium_carterae.1